VVALAVVLIGVSMPGNAFSPEKKATPTSSGGIQTRSISKATVDPAAQQNTTSLYNLVDKLPTSTTVPNSAASAAIKGQFSNNTSATETNKAPAGGEETDDPDDDFGDDDELGRPKEPVAHPSFNQIVSATWAAWGGSPAQVCDPYQRHSSVALHRYPGNVRQLICIGYLGRHLDVLASPCNEIGLLRYKRQGAPQVLLK
jgi:hypothetical protein